MVLLDSSMWRQSSSPLASTGCRLLSTAGWTQNAACKQRLCRLWCTEAHNTGCPAAHTTAVAFQSVTCTGTMWLPLASTPDSRSVLVTSQVKQGFQLRFSAFMPLLSWAQNPCMCSPQYPLCCKTCCIAEPSSCYRFPDLCVSSP
jgi:hypothetical protein